MLVAPPMDGVGIEDDQAQVLVVLDVLVVKEDMDRLEQALADRLAEPLLDLGVDVRRVEAAHALFHLATQVGAQVVPVALVALVEVV